MSSIPVPPELAAACNLPLPPPVEYEDGHIFPEIIEMTPEEVAAMQLETQQYIEEEKKKQERLLLVQPFWQYTEEDMASNQEAAA
jgi:hypothetical protein